MIVTIAKGCDNSFCMFQWRGGPSSNVIVCDAGRAHTDAISMLLNAKYEFIEELPS